MRKRMIALLLAAAMLLALAACGSGGGSETERPGPSAATPTPTPTAKPEPTPEPLDEELQRAYDAGLLPDGWLGGMEQTITFAEYAQICTELVKKWDESRLGEWNEKVKLAAASSDPMDTEDGYLMLSYIWVMMGYSHINIDGFLVDRYPEDEYGWVDEGGFTREESMKELSWDYPFFPDWETVVYDIFHADYMWGAFCSFPDVMSRVSDQFMFSYDYDNQTYHMQDPLSRDTAVRALLRMAEYGDGSILEPDGDYIRCTEVGTYDNSVITDELLNKETALPEVTQDRLPTAWRGAGLSTSKNNLDHYCHYSKADIQFMADNGFNFARLYLNFQSFRYPDYPADPYQVNLNELRELDQLVAWCMELDIHLQISMNQYMDETGTTIPDRLPDSDADLALTKAYWEMLSKRYAEIPSRYITFDICNEVEPQNEADMDGAIRKVAEIANAIWQADPDRVALYSQAGNASLKWTELLASNGIAVGCHPYSPNFITAADWSYVLENPYAEACWPQPYFPVGNVILGRAPLTIRGEIAGANLSVHVRNSGGATSIEVLADGMLIDTFPLTEGEERDGEYYHYDTIYTSDIPENATEITLNVRGDHAVIDTIILEGRAGRTVMVPSDVCDYPDNSDPLPLIVNPDGSYTNSEDLVYDADYIYALAVKPYRDIADRYGVGFMVNEFGMYGTLVFWDIDVVTAFHETYLEMLEKYDIPWCYCELQNDFPKHILIKYGSASQWTGATVKEVEYDGVTLKYCVELLDVFRKHTLK